MNDIALEMFELMIRFRPRFLETSYVRFCSNLLSKKDSNLHIFIKKYVTALKSIYVI